MPCPFCHQEHPLTTEQALQAFAEGPRHVLEAVAGLSQSELGYAEPKPGGWSPVRVLRHLMQTEMIWSGRLRAILAEENPTLIAFDQDALAALPDGDDAEELLRVYESLRCQNVKLLRSVPTDALDRAGVHPAYGRLTVRDHLLHGGVHDANHAAQIRRIHRVYVEARAGKGRRNSDKPGDAKPRKRR